MIIRLIRTGNAHPIIWVLFIGAGALFHIAAEVWWKGLLMLTGALLLDIGVDLTLTKLEKDAGEID